MTEKQIDRVYDAYDYWLTNYNHPTAGSVAKLFKLNKKQTEKLCEILLGHLKTGMQLKMKD